jgi:hypothetical protein
VDDEIRGFNKKIGERPASGGRTAYPSKALENGFIRKIRILLE